MKRNEWTITIILIIIALVASIISITYYNILVTGPTVPDIVHKYIAFNPWYSHIAEIFLAITSMLFIISAYHQRTDKPIPFALSVLAAFAILRALILPLTPLTNPFPYPEEFSPFSQFNAGGAFPSGHAGFAILFFLLIPWKEKKLKYTALFTALLTGFFMIISRGHYTIDVVGGILLGYATYRMMDYLWKRRVARPKIDLNF
ncbi:MAG: phosphatase PAP2 family protein [Candidatus Woesearchaeota archaeon]